MIHKHVENPEKSSSKSVRIRSLVEYVSNPDDGAKCIFFDLAPSFISVDIRGAIAEMTANSKGAVRSADTIHHVVLSWPENETPTPVQAAEAALLYIKHIGFEDHLYVFALHDDTLNRHLHIVLDRATPEGDVQKINRGFTQIAGAEAIALIESTQGWRPEENAMFAVLEDGTLVRSQSHREASDLAPAPPQRVVDQANRAGGQSRIEQVQSICSDIFSRAQSWSEVHETLASFNLKYERKGRGAVIRLSEDEALKASSISRYASLHKLTARLGPFEEPREALPTPVDVARDAEAGPSITHPEQTDLAAAFERYHAAIAAERYRLTARRVDMKTGKELYRVLDTKPGELIGLTPEEVRSRLPELMDLNANRHDLYMTPLSSHCHHLVFDDICNDGLKRLKQDGVAPAAVLEAAPGLYNVIVNIPRAAGDAYDLEAAGAVAAQINSAYSSPKPAPLHRAHPMPGSRIGENKQDKTKRSPFLAQLVEATGGICRALSSRFRKVYHSLRRAPEVETSKPIQDQTSSITPAMSYDLALALYEAHRIDVMRGPIKNLSQLDTTIADRLVATGLTRIEVAATIEAGAQHYGRFAEDRNAVEYAERTAEYACRTDVVARCKEQFDHLFSSWQKITDSVISPLGMTDKTNDVSHTDLSPSP